MVEPRNGRPVAELLPGFALLDRKQALVRVSDSLALQIARTILHKDMAYDSEIIPLSRADDLARRFLALFINPPTEYFSNGSFTQRDDGAVALSEWSPLTQSTFDTGIIVVESELVGCLWVEDED